MNPSGMQGEAIEAPTPASGWTVVMAQELRDLWLAWRGPVLVLASSLLLSLLTYLAATNQELNLLDQRDTVNLVMQISLAVGVAISLLVTADGISGERERGTLETLLLTPVPTRQLALGKLLAALSVWPVVAVVAIPYVLILRSGGEVARDAIASGFVVGLLLAITFSAFGLAVSTISASNRVSLAVCFFIFLALLVPTQLPGGATSGWLGELLSRLNPMTAGSHFMKEVTVANDAWGQEAPWLISPVVAALVMPLVTVSMAARMRLQGGLSG